MTDDEMGKVNILISSLPTHVADENLDLLQNLHSVTPYTTLKTELLQRSALSNRYRIRSLLKAESLGSQTPSQLLRRMKSLMGGLEDPTLLKELFLQRLPHWIRQHLDALPSQLPILLLYVSLFVLPLMHNTVP